MDTTALAHLNASLSNPLLVLQMLQQFAVNNTRENSTTVLDHLNWLTEYIERDNLEIVDEVKQSRCSEEQKSFSFFLKTGASGYLLNLSVKKMNKEAMEWLLNHHAEVNSRYEGGTALHIATAQNNDEFVKLLLSWKADATLYNNETLTPLLLAARMGHVEVVRTLLDHNPTHVYDVGKNKNTALHEAATAGHKDVVELLISKGASLDLQNEPLQETPFLLAAAKGHKHVLETLVKNDAYTNATDKNYDTALHRAAREGRRNIIGYLLTLGININAQNKDQKTALFVAVDEGHDSTAEMLIENGTRIDIRDIFKNTLLHVAASTGSTIIANIALNKSVDVNSLTNAGATPLHIAAAKNNTNVAKILLKNKALTNHTNKLGETPLHFAARHNSVQMVELLLEHDSDLINIKDDYDRNAEQTAENYRSFEVQVLLLKKR